MSMLLLVNERTGDRWQVWPHAAAIPPGGVQETGSYVFELSDTPGGNAAELLVDDEPLEALRASRSDAGRWRWLPGFGAGVVEMELRVPGRSARRFEITTDPDLRKLTRDDFDAMVRDILGDTMALFALTGFRKGVARGEGARAPSIARLEFLRSRIAEIESVVALVARSPRRILAAEDSALPYHRAARATSAEILRSFRTGRILQEAPGQSRLPASLQRFLPERIRVRQRRSSLDIPEHRQMAACLRFWSEWLTLAAESLEGEKARDPERRDTSARWAGRCRSLARRITRMTTLAPFAEASDARPGLTISSLFRRDPLYRRFYRLYQDMNAGIASVFGDFLNVPVARTFELYELWCFLRLVRASVEEFGAGQVSMSDLFLEDAHGGVTLLAGAVTVGVGAGWKICFQKRYCEFWTDADRRGSYSRSMVPDVVMTRSASGADAPTRMIVLDAKYRIDDGLNDALNSIHTYSDALVQEADFGEVRGIVSAAYLMTPHVPVAGADYRSLPMPARLFHPQYRARFCFGAVSLRPGMTTAEIASALRLVVADATAGGRSDRWMS